MKKKVKNVEVSYRIKDLMKINTSAIDYLTDKLNNFDFIPEDFYSKDELSILNYITFSLYFLDVQYMKAFKELGGKL